jgi:4-hydroxyphenylpyruvate dioxygenase
MPQTNSRFRPSVATMSLGSPNHCLRLKLELAAAAGFEGIEMYWDDLAAHARAHHRSDMRAAASSVADLCADLDLAVISVQPFRNYDGIICPDEHTARLDEFREWMRIAALLRTDTIGVPATIDPRGHHVNDRNAVISDMRELAELAATRDMRIAYENLCFSASTSTWQDAWDVVRSVGLDNIGFLPDTFNICGSAYADPGNKGMRVPDAERAFKKSMDELSRRIDPKRVFAIQVADGEWLPEPIGPGHPWMQAPGVLNPHMAWSRNARMFPLERGAFLPVLDVLRALTERKRRISMDRESNVSDDSDEGSYLGASDHSEHESVLDEDDVVFEGDDGEIVDCRGWISMEVFSRTAAMGGDEVVHEHVARAWKSWVEVKRQMGWY